MKKSIKNNELTYSLSPIGIMHTPFKEKFGIPRGPGLAPHAWGRLELFPPFSRPEMWKGLEGHPLVWVTFIFHQVIKDGWKATVRPPRLGGKERLGVFATRSPHRPNFLGQSLLNLSEIKEKNGHVQLHFSGVDLLNETPIIDIKPYIADIESRPISNLKAFQNINDIYKPLNVVFSPLASELLKTNQQLKSLISEIIALDPRPAFTKKKLTEYSFKLESYDVHWHTESENENAIAIVDVLNPISL